MKTRKLFWESLTLYLLAVALLVAGAVAVTSPRASTLLCLIAAGACLFAGRMLWALYSVRTRRTRIEEALESAPQFWLRFDDQRTGPYSAVHIRRGLMSGAISGLTVASVEGSSDWTPLDSFRASLRMSPASPDNLPRKEAASWIPDAIFAGVAVPAACLLSVTFVLLVPPKKPPLTIVIPEDIVLPPEKIQTTGRRIGPPVKPQAVKVFGLSRDECDALLGAGTDSGKSFREHTLSGLGTVTIQFEDGKASSFFNDLRHYQRLEDAADDAGIKAADGWTFQTSQKAPIIKRLTCKHAGWPDIHIEGTGKEGDYTPVIFRSP